MQRYPLSWPDGWKRTQNAHRVHAKFSGSERVNYAGGGGYTRKRDLTIAESTARVMDELRKLGVLEGDSIISTNLQVRLDGLPRSGQAEPADPGVAVYWQVRGEPMRVMAIDQYYRTADNLAAVAATLNAMRAIERHGGAQILERAFTGFDALPDPNKRNWRDVLGNDISTRAELDAIYKRLRSDAHPDRPGGNAERFNDVQRAYEQACQELKS